MVTPGDEFMENTMCSSDLTATKTSEPPEEGLSFSLPPDVWRDVEF